MNNYVVVLYYVDIDGYSVEVPLAWAEDISTANAIASHISMDIENESVDVFYRKVNR